MQVRRAILWLRDERADHLRYAAALVLRQLAENAPAVFNVHVKPFIEVIWERPARLQGLRARGFCRRPEGALRQVIASVAAMYF